ncbi:cupin domain-containing protein [Actinomadura miaoliensis]|uniref:Cupin domain-containing protein n=1 Tax=Actinomadura miaoliensis TaxID=430685 RepID=A0ABP7WH11_9ACTN
MTEPDMSDLEKLYARVDAAGLRPLWTITEQLLTPTPRPKAVPWLWPAATMRPLAEEAIRLVPVERGGERRVLSLANPGLGGRPYAAGTLWGALQALGPYESAPAHRHSPGAIRFVLEGEGVWTTVNGDACDMAPGDLVLTPAWAWHDHTNGGDAPMFWFDGLDLPMIEALDGVFFEPYPEQRQLVDDPHNASEGTHRPAYARAGAVTTLDPAPSPLLVYRWADTDAELSRLAGTCDDAVVELEYTNPESGASVLPTLSCGMLRVLPGRRPVRPVRRGGNTVFVVFRGEGHTVMDGRRFDWRAGDMFVAPSWVAVEHHAAVPSDLFALGDAPVHRALGIYREESLPGPQTVTGTFTGTFTPEETP